jgi:hypothetical protein
MKNMKRKTLRSVSIVLALLAIALPLSNGCGKGDSQSSQPGAASSSSPKKTTQTPFERDLDFVRTSRFKYVFVFSRTDGGTFDKESIDYLKANSPQETNQWVITDDKRYAIAGTHFEFKQEHFDALGKRFKIEDYSGK